MVVLRAAAMVAPVVLAVALVAMAAQAGLEPEVKGSRAELATALLAVVVVARAKLAERMRRALAETA